MLRGGQYLDPACPTVLGVSPTNLWDITPNKEGHPGSRYTAVCSMCCSRSAFFTRLTRALVVYTQGHVARQCNMLIPSRRIPEHSQHFPAAFLFVCALSGWYVAGTQHCSGPGSQLHSIRQRKLYPKTLSSFPLCHIYAAADALAVL